MKKIPLSERVFCSLRGHIWGPFTQITVGYDESVYTKHCTRCGKGETKLSWDELTQKEKNEYMSDELDRFEI